MNRVSWVVTKYDDCLAILKDSETFSSRSNAEVGKVMGRTVIEMDGKEHTRHRALVQQVFVPKGLDGLQPVLDSMLGEVIDGFAGDRRADLVQQFTERFPVQVMAHMIGVPRADYPQFQKWAIDIIGFVKDYPRGYAAAAAVREYLLPVIAARRAAPTGDVISKLVTGTVDGQGLSDEEVVSFLRLLLPAGAETTFRLIGNMLVALLVERDRWERVRADRALVPWVIEETLRWETSVLMVSRQTTRPTVIRGIEIAGRRDGVRQHRVGQSRRGPLREPRRLRPRSARRRPPGVRLRTPSLPGLPPGAAGGSPRPQCHAGPLSGPATRPRCAAAHHYRVGVQVAQSATSAPRMMRCLLLLALSLGAGLRA